MKFIYNFLKKFTKPSNITHLGRWEHRVSDNIKFVRATYANIDHCGDKICGQPESVRKTITKS